MPSWTDLVSKVETLDKDVVVNWLVDNLVKELNKISTLREGRNVIFYASAFLQKPTANQGTLSITSEDINGFMSVIHGMDFTKGLTILLHTPGGVTNATETIVSYLRSKFKDIEVIIPTYAMSAGTMISLSCDRIIMGRQSQLGPIDPQMNLNGRFVSALAIIDQFERAKQDILENSVQAHLWAPTLSTMGPALLQESQNAVEYSEQIVADWLESYVFKGIAGAKKKSEAVSAHFSRGSVDGHKKKSHGRRIDRIEAKSQGLCVEDLEDSQDLQEYVLTAYHLLTILFDKSTVLKFIGSNHFKIWLKNSTIQNKS